MNKKPSAAVSIVAICCIAAVTIVSAVHMCVVAMKFTRSVPAEHKPRWHGLRQHLK